MSNFKDFPNCRPIDRVEENLAQIHDKLNCMKVDVATIKSDLQVILQRIKEKEVQEAAILRDQVKKQEDIAKGWFFSI